jgi:hypothetical protein
MDPATLAVSAINFILPYLKNIGETAAKKTGEKLFEILSQRLSGHSEAKTELDRLRQEPDSTQAQSQAAAQLGKVLGGDATFADSIREFLKANATVNIDMKAGDNSNQVGQVFGNADFSRHGK